MKVTSKNMTLVGSELCTEASTLDMTIPPNKITVTHEGQDIEFIKDRVQIDSERDVISWVYRPKISKLVIFND